MIERLRKNSKKGLLEFIVIIPLIVAVLIFVGTAIGYEVVIAYFGSIDDMYGLYIPEEATIDYSLLPTVLEYNTTYIGDDFSVTTGLISLKMLLYITMTSGLTI